MCWDAVEMDAALAPSDGDHFPIGPPVNAGGQPMKGLNFGKDRAAIQRDNLQFAAGGDRRDQAGIRAENRIGNHSLRVGKVNLAQGVRGVRVP